MIFSRHFDSINLYEKNEVTRLLSRFDFVRLTLFRVMALMIMLALLAGSFCAYSAEKSAAAEASVSAPVATPFPTPDDYTVTPPDVAPPVSASDLIPNVPALPLGPMFVSASGEELSYKWGEPIPASKAADDEWFADAAFIGNSLCDGLMLFGTIKEASFFCAQSINVQNIYSEKCINTGGGEYISIIDALEREQYKKIFVMLGINEVFRDPEWFYEKYAALVDHLRETEPDAEIYLHSILPVTEKKSGSGYYNKTNVLKQNEQIVQLCKDKKVYYIDLYSHFADTEGFLPSEASTDGVHLIRSYYQVWSDYLKTHTITEVSE